MVQLSTKCLELSRACGTRGLIPDDWWFVSKLNFRKEKKEPLILQEDTRTKWNNTRLIFFTPSSIKLGKGRARLHDDLHATGPDLLYNITAQSIVAPPRSPAQVPPALDRVYVRMSDINTAVLLPSFDEMAGYSVWPRVFSSAYIGMYEYVDHKKKKTVIWGTRNIFRTRYVFVPVRVRSVRLITTPARRASSVKARSVPTDRYRLTQKRRQIKIPSQIKYRKGEWFVTEFQRCRLTGQTQILRVKSTIKLMIEWRQLYISLKVGMSRKSRWAEMA